MYLKCRHVCAGLSHLCVCSVGEADVGHVELSIMLSHVDPKAARKKYKALAKGK